MLLAAADDVGRVFDHADTANWPRGRCETFHRLGVLRRRPADSCALPQLPRRPHGAASRSACGPGGKKRFYISCPESMRVEVPPEMCECWEIDPAGLAGAVASLMGLKGNPEMVVADRFWRLGRTPWPPGSSHTREVVLAIRCTIMMPRPLPPTSGRAAAPSCSCRITCQMNESGSGRSLPYPALAGHDRATVVGWLWTRGHCRYGPNR